MKKLHYDGTNNGELEVSLLEDGAVKITVHHGGGKIARTSVVVLSATQAEGLGYALQNAKTQGDLLDPHGDY